MMTFLLSQQSKIEALVDPKIGFGLVIALTIWSLILHNGNLTAKTLNYMSFGAMILAIVQTVLFILPDQAELTIRSNSLISKALLTPFASYFDLLIYCGFFALYKALDTIRAYKKRTTTIPHVLTTTVLSAVVLLTIVQITFTTRTETSIPHRFFWQTTISTLNTPQTAFYGVGIGNYKSAFDRFKSPDYNQSPLWNLSVMRSKSFALHVLTETGVIGMAAFLIVMILIVRTFPLTGLFLLLAFLFLPPSQPLLLILFTQLSGVMVGTGRTVSLDGFMRWLILIPLTICFVTACMAGYYLTKQYQSEVYYKRALDSQSEKNFNAMYHNIRIALQNNPYIANYHLVLSQIHLLSAHALTQNTKEISTKNRETLTMHIQQAIAEAKIAVSLNPERAEYWKHLGFVYKTIMDLADGANLWALSSYQRAGQAAPSDPEIPLAIGGIYHRTGEFEKAIKYYSEAARLKTDWANAYYNLALAYHALDKTEEFRMTAKKTLSMLDKKSPEYTKAVSDFEALESKKIPMPKDDLDLDVKLQTKIDLNNNLTNPE